MSGGSDLGRWALEDEQLEALLLGTSPAEAGLSGNPVAEFFADAGHARGVAAPRPDLSLRQLFTTGDLAAATSTGPGGPATSDGAAAADQPVIVSDDVTIEPGPPAPAPDPVADPVAGTSVFDEVTMPRTSVFDEFDEPAAARTSVFDGFDEPAAAQTSVFEEATVAPTPTIGGAEVLEPVGAAGFEAGVGADGPAGPAGDLPFRGLFEIDPNEPAPSYRRYRPSPFRAAIEVLRPTGPKLLMVAALVVFLGATAHALGVYRVSFLPSESVENQAIGDGTGLDDLPGSGSTPGADEGDASAPADGASTPAGATDDTRFVVTSVSIPETKPTTAAQPTTTTTVEATTSSSLEATSSTAETTTTLDATSTSVDTSSTTDPNGTSSTTDPTGSSSTVDTTDTTVDSSSTTVVSNVVNLPLGVARFVPRHVPAGNYQGLVPATPPGSPEIECVVSIFRAGGEQTLSKEPGEAISFSLADGDGVVNGVGCPSSYTVN